VTLEVPTGPPLPRLSVVLLTGAAAVVLVDVDPIAAWLGVPLSARPAREEPAEEDT
jgi:hypothetical protein